MWTFTVKSADVVGSIQIRSDICQQSLDIYRRLAAQHLFGSFVLCTSDVIVSISVTCAAASTVCDRHHRHRYYCGVMLRSDGCNGSEKNTKAMTATTAHKDCGSTNDEPGFQNKGLVWTMSKLIGSEVEVLTSGNERLHGILDTFTRNASIVLKSLKDVPKDKHLQVGQDVLTTVVIKPEHLVCLKGKFTDQSSSRFTDDAIISKTVTNGTQISDDVTLIPWEDDDATTQESSELILDDNDPVSGWDSSNMLSTFEKANPGKTSYFGMEQYTNVEVPVLCENKVREISQLFDRIQPIEDDFKEDDNRTEEQKFAAVERTVPKPSLTSSFNKTAIKPSRNPEKDNFYWTNARMPNVHNQSSRKKERFGSLRFGGRQCSNRDVITLSTSSIQGDLPRDSTLTDSGSQSQSARSSPYPRKAPSQHQHGYPSRSRGNGGGRGSLRYNRSRYRGHPSLPIEMNRVNSQDSSMYYYNQTARHSPIRRYDLEMYERQQQQQQEHQYRQDQFSLQKDTSVGSVTAAKPCVQGHHIESILTSNIKEEHSSQSANDKSHDVISQNSPESRENAISPVHKNLINSNVDSNDDSKREGSDEITHSTLNPMADVFIPSRLVDDEPTSVIDDAAGQVVVNDALPPSHVLQQESTNAVLSEPIGNQFSATSLVGPESTNTAVSEPIGNQFSANPLVGPESTNNAISEPIGNQFSATPLVGPFAVTPLLQALPTIGTQSMPPSLPAPVIASADYPYNRTAAYPTPNINYLASYAQPGTSNRFYGDIPIDMLRPMVQMSASPRRVNMPIVENPFYAVQNSQLMHQMPTEQPIQENRSRRYILTSDETSTTIQVPSTTLFNTGTRLSSSSNTDDVLDPADNNVVIESGFNSNVNYPNQKDYNQQLPSSEAQVYAYNLAALSQQQQAIQINNPIMPQPGSIQYTPAYYIVNPAAFASSGLVTPQALYQSTPFFQSYQLCGYPATPFGILPLTPSFHAPNPATAASMFVGQEHLFDSSPIRRSRFPGSGRRYSESVAVSNRPSSNALMHDISVGESLGRQNNVQ
ncbi:hypothetical protein GJ496_001994, partial [Pomphorhynchus laevis]